jgi:TolB protein
MNLLCSPVRRLGSLLMALCLSLAMVNAHAQFRVEVTGVGLTQLPVLVAPFKGEAQATQKLSQIVQADLTRSGQFKPLSAASLTLDEMSRPDWTALRPLSAEALVAGSITRLANGRYDVRARLWDAVKGQEKSDFKDNVTAADLRLSAHRVSDWVYQQMTGTPGVFTSRISYVTKSSGRYSLWIADSDGEGARSALTSPEPIISPSWSPNGAQLAYVSFESRKPVVYVHELATGQRRVVANFKGSNSAPAWAPDGRSLVATLSREGGSQLYRVSLQGGGEPQRLTSGNINTEPAFSPDGNTLYFVSDRGGSPQIYKMPAQGGPAERVTFSGNYNISPAVSPDGRWLAYVSRLPSGFRLHLMELATGQVSALTDSNADERPSFAANSRLLVYATQQGGEALMTTTLDGRIKARLVGQGGDIREPHWGPVRP